MGFAPVLPEDDYLHSVASDAHYSTVETYLCGFNIPAKDINCNIYLLWHHVLKTVSMHVFVYGGKKILSHQLAADLTALEVGGQHGVLAFDEKIGVGGLHGAVVARQLDQLRFRMTLLECLLR